jgi:magnesium-transporting ATPase (P-type)
VTDVKKIKEGAGIKTVMSTGDFQSTVTAINENENGRTEL